MCSTRTKRVMPRDGSLTPADLIGKLTVPRVECGKRGRCERYPIAKLAEKIGMHGKMTDWLYDLTKDCPRKRSPGLADPCGVRCPDLPKVL
jgi:hypothetical protein